MGESVSTTACAWELPALRCPWERCCSQASQCHHSIPLRETDLSLQGSHSPMGRVLSLCAETCWSQRGSGRAKSQVPQHCHHPIFLGEPILTPLGGSLSIQSGLSEHQVCVWELTALRCPCGGSRWTLQCNHHAIPSPTYWG